jgi:hypothetical protein
MSSATFTSRSRDNITVTLHHEIGPQRWRYHTCNFFTVECFQKIESMYHTPIPYVLHGAGLDTCTVQRRQESNIIDDIRSSEVVARRVRVKTRNNTRGLCIFLISAPHRSKVLLVYRRLFMLTSMKLYARFVHFLDLCPSSLALGIYRCLLYLRVLLSCQRLSQARLSIIGVKLDGG